MEGFDGPQPPGLPLLAILFRPDDGFPVGLQDQPGAGIGKLDAIARRLPDIEEERALDGMLVRPGLDMHAVLEEDIEIGRAHVELQSLMRIPYAVFCLKK